MEQHNKILCQLHDTLTRISTHSAAAPSSVSLKDLSSLQDAAVSLAKLHDNVSLSNTTACMLSTDNTAIAVIQLLLLMLLHPPAALFSGVGGAPCEPEKHSEAAGMTFKEAAAVQLQLLLLLFRCLGQIHLPATDSDQASAPDKDDGRERNRPRYVVGIVEITEEGNSEPLTAQEQTAAQLQQLLLQLLLVCALYAQQDIEARHSSSSSSSSKSEATELDKFTDSIAQKGLVLSSPWTSKSCQQQCEQILQHVALNAVFADAAQQQQQQQQQQQGEKQCSWQLLLSKLLPQLLDSLRDTLMAQHRHQKAQDRGEIGAYKGPDTFHRCLAARRLSWLTQHAAQPQHDDQQQQQFVGLLLPLLLATTEDPSPAVQRYGQAGLGWLGLTGLTGSPASLRWHRVLLMDAARRLVVGCEESCWATAMPAAASLVMAIEGKNARAAGYHQLVQELIIEAERNAHKPHQRLIFMGCLARLLPCLGLYIVRHFAQLVPLLLEWTHAYDEASVLAAVQVLGSVVQHAWPRMGVHAAVIWRHLVEVVNAAEERHWLETGRKQHAAEDKIGCHLKQEQVEGAKDQGLVQQHDMRLLLSNAVVKGVLEVMLLLARCGGESFAAGASVASQPSGSWIADVYATFGFLTRK